MSDHPSATWIMAHKRARCQLLARMRAAALRAAASDDCPKGNVMRRLDRIDRLLAETAAAYYEACPANPYSRPIGLA